MYKVGLYMYRNLMTLALFLTTVVLYNNLQLYLLIFISLVTGLLSKQKETTNQS